MIRKIILTMACFTMIVGKAGAQELNVWLNGGRQGLAYNVQNGQSSLLAGGSLGLGYTFPIARHWGILAGVTGGFYGTKTTLNNTTFTSGQVDNTGSAFEYGVQTVGYKETQRFFSFGVPVMLQYHTTGPKTQWYFNGGGKLLLPLDVKVKSSAQSLVLSGYYPNYNLELSDLPQHGFGTDNGWNGSTTYKLRTTGALVAETGLSFPLSHKTRLYTGLYFEYGVSNSKRKNTATAFVPYNPNGVTDIQAGTVLNTSTTGDARFLAYGIQVKLGFGHGKAKPATRPVPQEAPQINTPDTTQAKPATASQEKPQEKPQEKEPEQQQAQQPPAKPVVDSAAIEVVQQPVVFGTLNKIAIPANQRPHLDQVADLLSKNPDIRVSIIGHTCNIGTGKENTRVGLERARAVAKYLQDKGIDPGRMDITSAGDANPMVPNTTPANRSQNRRVTIECLFASAN